MSVVLNENLIKSQQLTQEEVAGIHCLHQVRLELFDQMQELNPQQDRQNVAMFVEIVEQVEFALQRAWRFDETRDKHTWWCQVPHCTCPVDANLRLVGKRERAIDSQCAVHTGSPV